MADRRTPVRAAGAGQRMRRSDIAAGLRWVAGLKDEDRARGAFEGMLLDLIEAEVDRAGEAALRRLAPATWSGVRDEVARRLAVSLGIDPAAPREPPPVRVVGSHRHDGVTIERLVLEPRPRFVAPALLYLPIGAEGPVPVVVVAVGHWLPSGKTTHHAQALCTGLARHGIAALAMDPLGQGEREAGWDAHGMPGLLPVGLSQLGVRVWELVRAIDHLLARPDIDPDRVGITGASGGGLATVFTAALDPRIRAAAAVCFVTSYARFLRDMRGLDWNGRGDLCNQVPGVIGLAEMAGVCGLISPRPLLLVNGRQDRQFSVEGASEVMDRLVPVYAGHPSALRLHVVDDGHGYSRPMREAAYGWFQRWLTATGAGTPIPEAPAELYPEGAPELMCGSSGEPVRSVAALRELIREEVTRMGGTAPSDDLQRGGPTAIREALGVAGEPASSGRLVERLRFGDVVMERHLVVPEPGVTVPATLLEPGDASGALAVLLTDEDTGPAAVRGVIRTLVQTGTTVLAIDPRGTGETAPDPADPMTLATLDGRLEEVRPSPDQHVEFEVATDCLMLGRSLLGQQVQDVLAATRYQCSIRPAGAATVGIVAIGPVSCLRAAFAAALEPSIGALWLERWPVSFRDIALADPPLPMTAYLFGVVRRFELDDVLGQLAARSVTIVRPLRSDGRQIDPRRVRRAYAARIAQAAAKGGDLSILGVVSATTRAAWAHSWH